MEEDGIHQWNCIECSTVYTTEEDLNVHMVEVHNSYPVSLTSDANVDDCKINQIPAEGFKCDICSRHFTTKPRLKSHIKMHEKEQCLCKYCDKSFANNRGLAIHVTKMHQDLTCETCGFK